MRRLCKACLGHGYLCSQHPGGEVRYPCCVRCDGTGQEPMFAFLRVFRSQPIDEGHTLLRWKKPMGTR
jgi:hypothetical protein